MAQPATSPLEFAPPFEDARDAGLHGLEGPANRALSELTLALNGKTAQDGAWSTGKTLRFVIVSCGLFWIATAAAFFTLHG